MPGVFHMTALTRINSLTGCRACTDGNDLFEVKVSGSRLQKRVRKLCAEINKLKCAITCSFETIRISQFEVVAISAIHCVSIVYVLSWKVL